MIYDQVMVAPVTVVSPPSTGTLPSPLAENTRYFVQNVAGNLIKLSTTIAGAAIDLEDGANTCRVYKIPARAMGKLTVSGTPVEGEKLVIGANTWTFKGDGSTGGRATAFEITVSTDNTTQAANIVTAVNMDSFEITANNVSGVAPEKAVPQRR